MIGALRLDSREEPMPKEILHLGSVAAASFVGGFGGTSGRSMWWGLLILPYLAGWNMGIWGPGSPRWLLWLGIIDGLLYQATAGMILMGRGLGAGVAVTIAAIGIVVLAGCIYRLWRMRNNRLSTPICSLS
jgi:hypothetical protein